MAGKEVKWVRGKALQTVIALRGFQKGDELLCGACNKVHVFEGWSESGAARISHWSENPRQQSVMHVSEALAWRPRGKQHS